MVRNKFLFNFAVSYSGGGFKRLHEYARWFDKNGGAWFVIHPRCKNLIAEFPNNRIFVAGQPRYQRIFSDCEYLNGIVEQTGTPELYYSYGIPIYTKARIGQINWFHLSNVLPLESREVPLSFFERLKLAYLGLRIRGNFANADVISAESLYSLGLVGVQHTEKLFLSVNGSDDELAYVSERRAAEKERIATVLGTHKYKAISDSYRVFEFLRQRDNGLKLAILGNADALPRDFLSNPCIIVKGILKRPDVIDCLRKSRYYISTTYIENSYNAASEGVFFADESYISDIGPHRELLSSMFFDRIAVPNVKRMLLHVKRADLTVANLKTWDDVVSEMMSRIYTVQEHPGHR